MAVVVAAALPAAVLWAVVVGDEHSADAEVGPADSSACEMEQRMLDPIHDVSGILPLLEKPSPIFCSL